MDFMSNYVVSARAVDGLFKLRILAERHCSIASCSAIYTADPADEFGLSLSLSQPTLDGCIADYFNNDVAQGANCTTCKQTGDHRLIKTVDAFPEILVIQLVRFQANYSAGVGTTQKNMRVIRYDEDLDLTAYADEGMFKPTAGKAGKTFQYKLQGVVAHMGSLNSGHYQAYARGPGGVVGRFSDETVSDPAPAQEWLAPPGKWTPYLLVYIAV